MAPTKVQKALQDEVYRFESRCKNAPAMPRMKFENYLNNVYFPERDPETGIDPLKRKTFDTYKGYAKRINRVLGHLWMNKIKRQDVKRFIKEAYTEDHKSRLKGKLSPKGIRNHYSFLTSVFRHAVQNDYIFDNPCHDIRLVKSPHKEVQIYSPEEATKILSLLSKDENMYHHYVFKVLEIYTGFRRGELCGLEWSDIDFEKELITVRRTSYYSHIYGTFTDTPKTNAGYRTIKPPSEVFEILKRFKAIREKHIEELANLWEGSERVFTTEMGKPICPNTPYNYFSKFCKRNGIPHLKPHSFRHLAASILINAGVDIHSVSRMLGHSAASTTLNIYAHAVHDLRAMDECEKAIAGSIKLLPSEPDGHQDGNNHQE
jgi:integrase